LANLVGCVALVTGGGRGIGRAVVEKLALAGAVVAAVARTEAEVRDVAEAVRSRQGTCLPLPGDVANEASVQAVFQTTRDRLGPVDLLVNNAGVFLDAPFCETPPSEWRRLFEINVMGAYHCVRAVLPDMLQRGRGKIINVCSTASHKPYAGQSAYCASKHALLGLSRVLAAETAGTGVRVHTISPGGVDTRLVRDSGRDVEIDAYMAPEEVAEIVVFLAGLEGKAHIDDIVVRRIGASI